MPTQYRYVPVDSHGKPLEQLPPGYTFMGFFNPYPNQAAMSPDMLRQAQAGTLPGMPNYGRQPQFNQPPTAEAPAWDFQNPPLDLTGQPLGMQGEPLPYGAESWDPWGRPYYGPGLQGWWKGVVSRFTDPTVNNAPASEDWKNLIDQGYFAKGASLGQVGAGLLKAGEMAVNAFRSGGAAPGASPTLLTYGARGVSEVIGGILAGFQAVAEQYERGAGGLAMAMEGAGEGSPLPAIPHVAPGGGAGGFVDFLLQTNPISLGYGLLRGFTSPLSEVEKARRIDEGFAAARMAYTAFTDPVAKQEFIRRYNAGEDEYKLAMELQNPWAEIGGQFAFDPLNVVDVWIGKGLQAAKYARDADIYMKVASPEVLRALNNVGEVASEGRAGEALGALLDAHQGAIRAETAKIAARSADYSPWALTAAGKRYLVGHNAGTLAAWVAANSDPGEAMDVFRALAMAASDDPEEALTGIAYLSRFKVPQPLFSKVGNQTGIILRRLMTEDGEFSPEKFLKAMEKMGDDPAALAEYASRRMQGVIDEMYPAISEGARAAERVKEAGTAASEADQQLAGWYNHLNPLVKSIDRFNEAAQVVVGPINRFFAGVYMGMSPGYAFRNAANNTFTTLVDLGPKAAGQAGGMSLSQTFAPGQAVIRAQDKIARWLGGIVPKGASTGFGPVASIGQRPGKGIFSTFLRVSENVEKGVSTVIVGNEVERTMRKMLRPGRALPEVAPLVQAGMRPELANMLGQLVTAHYGDVKAARKAFMQAAGNGRLDVVKLLSAWASPDDVTALEKFGWLDDIQEAIKRVKEAGGDPQEAIAEIDALRQAILQRASQAAAETPGITPEIMGEAASTVRDLDKVIKSGNMTDESVDLLQRQMQANSLVFRAYEKAFTDIITAYALPAPLRQAAASARGAMFALLEDASKHNDAFLKEIWRWNDQIKAYVKSGRKWKEVALDLGIDRGKYGIKDERSFYIALWKEVGMGDDEDRMIRALFANPKVLGGEISLRKAFLDQMWDGYFRPTRTDYWRAVREEYSTAMDDLFDRVDQAGALKVKIQERSTVRQARASLETARQFDNAETLGNGIFIPKAATAAGQAAPGTATEYSVNILSGLHGGKKGRIVANGENGLFPVILDGDATNTIHKIPMIDLDIDNLKPLFSPYSQGNAPSLARLLHEQRKPIEALFGRIAQGVGDNWMRSEPMDFPDPALRNAARAWFKEADGRIAKARLTAAAVGDAAREFALLDYNKKRYFDLALAYIFPFHFWYNRTYAHWLQRLVYDPGVVAGYARYKEQLEKIHAGQPDWWKYQINTNELLGLESEHPLYFNLEATLNPLNGLTGVDFTDPYKRVDWWTATLDDMAKFGPSLWTPLQLATAVGLVARGEGEAASRWAGRLIPQTTTLKSAAALLNIGAPELDPAVWLFSGGLDPYERRRVGRALGMLVQEGQISEAQAAEAAWQQQGDLWQQAIMRATQERAPGNLASFAFGVGFKARPPEEIEIDRMYQAYHGLWNMKENLSPDEFRQSMEQLRTQYPFMDAVLLSRKGGEARQRSYAYSVLSRIPPGQKGEIAEAAGIDPRLLERFWEEKGNIEAWEEGERNSFLNGIASIGALLDVPDSATRLEWAQASGLYSQVMDEGQRLFGEDIWERVDMYFAAKGATFQEKQQAEALLATDPLIEQALDWKSNRILSDPMLSAYYGGIEDLRSWYKGQMYDQIEKELGKTIHAHWREYWMLKNAADEDLAKQYWKDHPDLERYLEIRDAYAPLIAQHLIKVAGMLPQPKPGQVRPEAELETIMAQDIYGALQPGLPRFEWEEWQNVLSEPLQDLIVQSTLSGQALPAQGQIEIEFLAAQLGLSPDVLMQMIQASLQAAS